MKIYTKAGDAGETGLLGGDRVGKESLRIHAVGLADEVNAFVGQTLLTELPAEVRARLGWLQSKLFDIGGELACPPGGKFELVAIQAPETAALESEIDAFESELQPLKNFILPGGSPGSASLHVLRAVVRRFERALTELHRAEPVNPELLRFVNRLSDWIFCSARLTNARLEIADVLWTKE